MEDADIEEGTIERADQLPLDRRLELLADQRRRYVVTSLQEATAPVAVADLAKQLADWEADQSPRATPDHQDAVHCSLYHCHLPKLVDAGVVAHNPDQNTVVPAANFESVMELWTALPDVDDSDSE